MASLRTHPVILLIAVISISGSFCLECFECTSGVGSVDGDRACDKLDLESPDAEDFLVDCGDEGSCVSTMGQFGNTIVRTKECGRERATNSCASMRLGDATATICSCDDADACNQAGHIHPTASVVILAGALAAIFSMRS